MNLSIFSKKKVLITGVTGFKGSWLATWLNKLGSDVVGVANCIPTSPSLFEINKISKDINYIEADVRNYPSIEKIISETRPDFLFHLAAQAIVSESKKNPLLTIETNVVGTANVLNALRNLKNKCAAVIITSDKSYENVEWLWGYRENDNLGGKDIYSASKASAEIIFNSFVKTFFLENDNIKLATARAGNVIGGGDWSKDRIVVDCVTKWSKNEKLLIRSPSSTRPWQHVLEPLSGYLNIASKLYDNPSLNGESFNFGPKPEKSVQVIELINLLSNSWKKSGRFSEFEVLENSIYNESELLRLNCDKALQILGWEATLDFKECLELVDQWYRNYYFGDIPDTELTLNQITEYEKKMIPR